MWCSSSAPDLVTEVSSFPAPEVRDALVTAYFQHIHPFLPVISMPEFLAAYRSPVKPPPLLLFQALLMAGAHACEHPLVANDRHAVKSILFRRASLLYHSRHESDRIHLMQAAILFTWHIGDGDTVAGGPWYWSGIAVRVGCGLGAHRHSAILPAMETSQYRRSWWSAFIVETMSSLETGRPCAIRAEDMDQIALADEDMTDMLSVPSPPSGTPDPSGSIPGPDIHLSTSSTSADFLNHMVELSCIGLDILAANAPATERLVDLHSINARLGRWALSSGMSPATRTDDATRCHLRIHYNLMLLHLYRNFHSTESHTVRSTAAQAIIGSLERLADLNCLCQCHFTGVSAVTAAGIQLVKEIGAAIDAGNFLVAIPALDQLSRQLQCAKLLARYWPNADAVYGVFRGLHERYEGYAKHGIEGQQVAATESQPDWNLLLGGARFSQLDSLSVDQDWLNMPTWSGLM